MPVILVVWKNPRFESGVITDENPPVFEGEMEDVTLARMYYYSNFYCGYNGHIQTMDGNVLVSL